jgi:chromosome partitioning protein
MPVVAVVNRKGGSGKSTLATHLAAYYTRRGIAVTLGDVDPQQSTKAWLRQRRGQDLKGTRPINGLCVDPKSFARPPANSDLYVLDTPGGLRGFDLARVVMYADAILVPVCNSVFDRESAADCLAELRTLPRVATGRCKVATIAMRIDARTKGAHAVQTWASAHDLPCLTVLRESQAYVRSIEDGLTIFDLPEAKLQADVEQWAPIIAWLDPVLQPAQPVESEPKAARSPMAAPVLSTRELAATADATLQPRLQPTHTNKPSSPMTRLLDALPIPRFLQRAP